MKVSMNVRLHPLVRCSFDEALGQLRVALLEPAEDTLQERVVVYALKVRPVPHAHVGEDVLKLIRPARRGARPRGASSRTLRERSWRVRGRCASSSLSRERARASGRAYPARWLRRCLFVVLNYLLLYHYLFVHLCYHDQYAQISHSSSVGNAMNESGHELGTSGGHTLYSRDISRPVTEGRSARRNVGPTAGANTIRACVRNSNICRAHSVDRF